MKFSIMIPVYNVEKYIEKCLMSVIEQEFTDYEIIVVIDGSTDNSEHIASQIKAENPRVPMEIIKQENKGLGGARNTAMQYANGEYWLFVDSDDYLAPNALSVLDEVTKEDKYDLIYFNTYMVAEDGKVLQIFPAKQPPQKDTCLAKNRELIQTLPSAWNKLYKRTLFTDGIRYQEKKWFEDLDVALKIYFKAERILFIDDILYHYVQRKGSIMSSNNVYRNLEMLDIFDSIIDYYKENGAFEEYYEELQYLAIWKIMIFSMTRINMLEPNGELQDKLVDYMQEKFPGYLQNKYMGELDVSNLERVRLASERNFKELYQRFSRYDKIKQYIKYNLPSWAKVIYYRR